MEDHLRGIKHIANSLASIWTPVLDLELVQLTLNGLDEDYHNLVTNLAYGTTLLTFDNLRSKLIHYEQQLQLLKSKESFQVHHPALAATVISLKSGQTVQSSSSNHGNWSGGNKNKGRNNRKGNKHEGGGKCNSHQNQQESVNKGVPTGSAYGNTVFFMI